MVSVFFLFEKYCFWFYFTVLGKTVAFKVVFDTFDEAFLFGFIFFCFGVFYSLVEFGDFGDFGVVCLFHCSKSFICFFGCWFLYFCCLIDPGGCGSVFPVV